MGKSVGPNPALSASPTAPKVAALPGNDPGYGVLPWPARGFTLGGSFTALAIALVIYLAVVALP